MAQSRRWIEFFYGDLSNSHFPFPGRRRVFSGSSATFGEPLAAFSGGRGSRANSGYFWLICIIGSRKHQAFASVAARANRDQSLFLLRGLFFILSVLVILGILEGEILIQGEVSNLVFLAAGIAYAIGTVANWRDMQVRR